MDISVLGVEDKGIDRCHIRLHYRRPPHCFFYVVFIKAMHVEAGAAPVQYLLRNTYNSELNVGCQAFWPGLYV
jgi:hypothetical protein